MSVGDGVTGDGVTGDDVIVAIRVSPASGRTAVGGCRGDALIVRVTEAAVDGRATEAALVALAKALGVPRRDVRLRGGATSRDKIVAIATADGDVLARLEALRLGAGAKSAGRRRPS